MKLFSFKNFRILFLIFVLATVAIYTQGQRLRSTAWIEPLDIVIFPINGDNNEQTETYIRNLSAADFADIDRFTADQGRRYKIITRQPTKTRLGSQIDYHPPPPPAPEAHLIENMLWSLRLRWWAWRHTPDSYAASDGVHLFVLYHQGNDNTPLAHSLGMQKGLLGIVHAYADPEQNDQNNVVIAHEFMHTVGATDKYDNQGRPVFPSGYANPKRHPLYPQNRAEIMAGRMALSAQEAKMAYSLKSTVVGEQTAREINWTAE